MNSLNFRLYALPSFWEGVARIVDLGGTLNEYNYSDHPHQANFRAIQSDWEEVGADIIIAIGEFEEELEK